MMAQTVVENVVKQGYLKKGNSISTRLSGFFRRNDGNKWFVFTVRQGIPFLEYYDHDVDVFTQQPINSFNLSQCQNVKSMGNSNPTAFCIVCPERIIELIAQSRQQMVGWVNEIEASLVHLGILHVDVADHVYTVCPAVVRKPRPSKEAQEERDDDADATTPQATTSQAATSQTLATATTSQTSAISITTTSVASQDSNSAQTARSSDPANSSQRPSSPPPLPISSHRAKTFKPSSSRALPERPRLSVRHTSSSASTQEESPPPLPLRPPPYGGRAHSKKPSRDTVNEESDIHPDTGSSNDGDFVSAAVIAQLRLRHSNGSATDSGAELHTEGALLSEATGSSKPGTLLEPSNAISENPAESDNHSKSSSVMHNQPSNEPPSPDQQSSENTLKLCVSPATAEANGDTLSPISARSLSSTPDSPLCISSMATSAQVMENEYSALPCELENAERESKDVDNHSKDSVTVVSKPTPLPRRAMSKKSPSTDGYNFESQLTTDDVTCNSVSLIERSPSSWENTSSKVIEETSAGETNNEEFLGDGHTVVQQSVETDLELSTSSKAEKESQQTKDENENFYGLTFDDSFPPTTMAPAIPLVPPLPPRHDSLPATKGSIKSHMSSVSEHKNSVTSTTSSDITTSAVNSQNKVQGDPFPAAAPPLPRPRKKGPISDSFRKSLPVTAFSDEGVLEVPPVPQRRSPQRSLTQEDMPPALPARNSQSFFIKRPQITGKVGTNRNSGDKATVAKEVQTTSGYDNHGNGCSSFQELGASNTTSGLSRKMLLDRAHSLHTVVSLKQTQAEILQMEIDKTHVEVSLTQKSGFGLALVEWNGHACIVGWNQKDFPSLHGKLHIGDLIFSINNVKVTSPEVAQKLLRQAPSSKIDVMLRRMPYAKVFAIRRSAEGQSLGIRRERGTGEISYVDPNGLAAQHGLPQYANSAFGDNRCNWFLTEINNRPLNLFFKDNEIDHRLAAVGREISIVVQPSDFICEIRRQFKKLKNYKNFITQ